MFEGISHIDCSLKARWVTLLNVTASIIGFHDAVIFFLQSLWRG